MDVWLILESLLGLKLEGNRLHFAPCVPAEWAGFKVHYRYRETVYHITVSQTGAANDGISVALDGIGRDDRTIPLVDDRHQHSVEVRIPTPVQTA